MTISESFPPSINAKSKILILGSMPGVKSLNEHQYYAHPQNRFWKLMGKYCNYDNLADLNYNARLKILLDNGLALWDVIKSCNRTGSLDTNIQNEIPNPIPQLLIKYKNIERICLNGNKAYCSLKKHFPELPEQYECHKLPSTSPANAKYRLEDLYKEWNKAIYQD